MWMLHFCSFLQKPRLTRCFLYRMTATMNSIFPANRGPPLKQISSPTPFAVPPQHDRRPASNPILLFWQLRARRLTPPARQPQRRLIPHSSRCEQRYPLPDKFVSVRIPILLSLFAPTSTCPAQPPLCPIWQVLPLPGQQILPAHRMDKRRERCGLIGTSWAVAGENNVD